MDGDAEGRKVRKELVEGRYYREHQGRVICLGNDQFERYLPIQFKEEVEGLLRCDYKEKSKRKGDLIKQVISWADKNRPLAGRELGESAKEVIDHLKRIYADISEQP